MIRPVHPPYTGAYKTAGELAQQLIHTAEKINRVVSESRAQVQSQKARDVLHHDKDAERKDQKGKPA